MWEKLILASIATFCFYLFLHLGRNSTESKLLNPSLMNETEQKLNI